MLLSQPPGAQISATRGVEAENGPVVVPPRGWETGSTAAFPPALAPRLCLQGHPDQGLPAHPAPALGSSLAGWLEAGLTRGQEFVALSLNLSFATEQKL